MLPGNGASYVAPHHSRVVDAVDDLCAFIARTDVPLLVQCAVAHAMLHHAGATTRATVPVSAGLLRDTEGYFAALTAYREGDASPIVAGVAEASGRQRYVAWVAPQVTSALDAFAARARRG